MTSENPRPRTRFVGHTILRILVSFPIACFCGAFVTDIAYAKTADVIWADFSTWLLAAGIFSGALAAIGGIIEFAFNRHVRAQRQIWLVVIGGSLVLILGAFDNLVHSRDAWTSVVPVGLALSGVIVVVMLVTAWFASATIEQRDVELRHSGARR